MSYLMIICFEAVVILYLMGVVVHLQDRLDDTGRDLNDQR